MRASINRIMKRKLLSRSLIAIITFFAAGVFSVNAQTVSGSLGNGTVSRGSTAKGSIVLSIPGGLHVNSGRPNSEYAIPTTVRISGQGVKAGSVTVVGAVYNLHTGKVEFLPAARK